MLVEIGVGFLVVRALLLGDLAVFVLVFGFVSLAGTRRGGEAGVIADVRRVGRAGLFGTASFGRVGAAGLSLGGASIDSRRVYFELELHC